MGITFTSMINVIFQKPIQGCNDMKSTILLSTALFLASAPSPDSKAISEISAGFLVITENIGLMASEAEISTETKIDVLKDQEDS